MSENNPEQNENVEKTTEVTEEKVVETPNSTFGDVTAGVTEEPKEVTTERTTTVEHEPAESGQPAEGDQGASQQ